MARWFWILLISMCVAFIFVNADGSKKGSKSRSKSSNHTKSATTVAATTEATTPAPTPPPPKSCDDEGKCAEKNKKCSAESKCICDLHFREILDGSCVPKPQLGESCFDNFTWLDCDGQGVDSNCYSGSGPNRGKCVCAKGHEPSQTDKNCSPITKKLSEACKNDAECFIAYSACTKSKCACIDGFTAGDDGLCKPNNFMCPSGKPNQIKGSVIPCEVDFNDTTGTIGDNCGSGSFCFVPPHTLTNLGKPIGHCCPTPATPDSAQLVCPYGEPLANVTCPDRKADTKKDVPNTCPLLSHQCFAVQQRPHDMICCPNPCRQSVSHFDYNGQCFDYVLLGRSCTLAAQCTGEADCVDSGGSKVCKCKKGYTQVSANQCEES